MGQHGSTDHARFLCILGLLTNLQGPSSKRSVTTLSRFLLLWLRHLHCHYFPIADNLASTLKSTLTVLLPDCGRQCIRWGKNCDQPNWCWFSSNDRNSFLLFSEVIGPFLGGLLIDFCDFPMAMTCIGFINLGVAGLLLFYQLYLSLLGQSKQRHILTTDQSKSKQSTRIVSVDVANRSVTVPANIVAEEHTPLLANSNISFYRTLSCP